MDNENLKALAEEVGDYVRDQVSGIENRLADLATDVAAIPEARDGVDGERGEKGDQGDSITGSQGERGDVGPEGPPGPVGSAGESIQGEKGDKGDTGESIIGPEGAPGPAGKDGESVQGQEGQQGEPGEKGDQGAAGTGIEVAQWVEGVYREGSEVQHHFGQFFRALSDTAESPDVSLDWERVGSAGFRLTGSYAKEFDYRDGDLFVKDFGLFLHKGGESVCIAGRGPQGQKGKAGSAGRDGQAGADGSDGKDGSSIEALELRGANLVAVFKNADGEVKDHAVSLEPFLKTAALVTKEAHSQNSKVLIDQADTYVRKLFGELNSHLDDDSATPITFYRGLWKADVGYQVGDWIRYGTEGFLCKQACRGVMPKNYPNQKQTAVDYWQSVSGLPTHGGGADGAGVTSDDVMVTEGGEGGVKFSGFTEIEPDAEQKMEVVGLRDGENVRAELTTDLVSVNPNAFRDRKGRFAPAPEDLEGLTNQRGVNELLWKYTQEGMDTQEQIESVLAAGLDAQSKLEDRVFDLEITKGSVARYRVANTDMIPVARSGEMSVGSTAGDATNSEQVDFISIAPVDLDDVLTKPVHLGDVIEFDFSDGNVVRYIVTSVVNESADAMGVEFLNGSHHIAVSQILDCFVYPQNQSTASREYVDELVAKAVAQASPIGSIVFWGGNRFNIPTGWIECNEQKLPDDVAAILGTPYAPDLKNYMPAGIGGVFGETPGKYAAKHHKHRHIWQGPSDRKGYPQKSGDVSDGTSANQSYWRGNKGASNSTSSGGYYTAYDGDRDFACPPVQTGVYIMRIF